MKLPDFEPDSRLIVWPEREKPLTIDGPHRKRRDWNKLGHVAVIVVSIAIGAPLVWHVIATWGQ